MPVSKRLRYEILKRDNHACRYCGQAAPDVKLTIDHVLPVALGGSDDASNLVTACSGCNAGKSSTVPEAPLVADVSADSIRWAEAIKAAAEIRANAHKIRDEYVAAFVDEWSKYGDFSRLPGDFEFGIIRLYEAGLPQEEMLRAVFPATANRGVVNRFSYFMGICWNAITAIQDAAREMITAEAVDNG